MLVEFICVVMFLIGVTIIWSSLSERKKIKCVTTIYGEWLYFLPDDADYKTIEADKYCVTETEALTQGYHRKNRMQIAFD